MKLYQRSYLKIGHGQEVANGLYLTGDISYEDRKPLNNIEGFNDEGLLYERFTSNNPLDPDGIGTDAFEPHKALTLKAGLRIRFQQRYETTPKAKFIRGSKYPTLQLWYTQALPVLGSSTNFGLLEVGAYDEMDFSLLGKGNWSVNTGFFFNTKYLPFTDWQHFSGNQTSFLNRKDRRINTFHLLPYYSYSTNDTFAEAHYEHHFNGFLINKLPLLRKTKFQAVGGVNYLYSTTGGNYYEVFAGVENILKVLRVDWATSFSKDAQLSSGIRIGITIQ